MALNRGSEDNWLPTDGRQDKRPVVKCSGCQTLTSCYRGPLLRSVTNERGTWDQFAWWCTTCLSEIVGEALRQAEK